MKREEFDQAVAIARDVEGWPDLQTDFDSSLLEGFALADFGKKHVLLEVAASCIRWQCLQWSGGWDHEAMEECRVCFKDKVIIVGNVKPPVDWRGRMQRMLKSVQECLDQRGSDDESFYLDGKKYVLETLLEEWDQSK